MSAKIILVLGNIATGKTTIIAKLKNLLPDCLTIEVDKIVKDIYNTSEYNEFLNTHNISLSNHKTEILEKILENKSFLDELNQFFHPIIREQVIKLIKNNTKKTILVESPINLWKDMSSDWKIIVMKASKRLRLARLKEREKYNSFDIKKILKAFKISYKNYDIIINTSKNISNEKIVKLARKWGS